MKGRELKSCPCARFNYNQMIKETRPRRNILLNPGVRSIGALIKSKCIIRLAKQRSIIKDRKLNLLIKSCISGRKSGSNNQNGSAINRRVVIYPFILVKFHFPSERIKEWIKFANHEKEVKPYTSAEPNILINRNVFANWITYFSRLVSHSMKVKSFIPGKPNVLINKSALENQIIYSRSKKYPLIPVEYIATNKKSNIMEEESILRIDRSTPVGAYSFQKRIQGTQIPVLPIPAKIILW
jgi:hypothetical protein